VKKRNHSKEGRHRESSKSFLFLNFCGQVVKKEGRGSESSHYAGRICERWNMRKILLPVQGRRIAGKDNHQCFAGNPLITANPHFPVKEFRGRKGLRASGKKKVYFPGGFELTKGALGKNLEPPRGSLLNQQSESYWRSSRKKASFAKGCTTTFTLREKPPF